MIILGIDPGLAIVGYGVIEAQKGAFRPIDCGVINTPKSDTVPIRLNKIYDGMLSLIEKYKPDCIAIEELFSTPISLPVSTWRRQEAWYCWLVSKRGLKCMSTLLCR